MGVLFFNPASAVGSWHFLQHIISGAVGMQRLKFSRLLREPFTALSFSPQFYSGGLSLAVIFTGRRSKRAFYLHRCIQYVDRRTQKHTHSCSPHCTAPPTPTTPPSPSWGSILTAPSLKPLPTFTPSLQSASPRLLTLIWWQKNALASS